MSFVYFEVANLLVAVGVGYSRTPEMKGEVANLNISET
jgi:hypothetical protein